MNYRRSDNTITSNIDPYKGIVSTTILGARAPLLTPHMYNLTNVNMDNL